MNASSDSEKLAKRIEKIKNILEFKGEEKLDKAWGWALNRDVSLGYFCYEVMRGDFVYSDKVCSHNSKPFFHVWEDLARRRWIRGQIFKMGKKNVLFVHVEDFCGENASGGVLAAMVRKVTEVIGCPISMFVDEQGRVWGEV